ncbi:oligosaccharide repeat unit polymerase [Enterovibrio norvegicus]|uniref:O-antigen polymerase n=1 Tax=Enterovibrio norvegicus TaxID=188144 RepID=UPI003D0F39AE
MIMNEGRRRNISGSISNPFWISVLLLFVIILYFLRLTTSISEPSFETIILLSVGVFTCSIAIFLGGGSNIISSEYLDGKYSISKSMLYLLWLLYFVSILFYIFEHVVFYIRFGGVPISLIDFEIKRLVFPISGYVHLVAMMSYIFLLVIIFERVYFQKRGRLYDCFLFTFFIFSVLLSLLVGNRGVVLSFLFFVSITLSFKYKFSMVKLFLYALVLSYLLGVAKLFRDYAFYGDSVFESISRNWSFGDNLVMAPLYFTYMTFVMNFEMLNKYVDSSFEHTLGYFTLYSPLVSVLPVELVELKDFQRSHLDIDFHGTLTATGYGVPYIDFSGFSVMIIAGWCFILSRVYYLIMKKGDISFIPLYSYLLFNVMLFVYTYPFNKFYVLLNVLFLYFSVYLFKGRSTS